MGDWSSGDHGYRLKGHLVAPWLAGGPSRGSMASWEDISLRLLLNPEPEVTPSSAETSDPLSRGWHWAE